MSYNKLLHRVSTQCVLKLLTSQAYFYLKRISTRQLISLSIYSSSSSSNSNQVRLWTPIQRCSSSFDWDLVNWASYEHIPTTLYKQKKWGRSIKWKSFGIKLYLGKPFESEQGKMIDHISRWFWLHSVTFYFKSYFYNHFHKK